jgi:hypothetical protein
MSPDSKKSKRKDAHSIPTSSSPEELEARDCLVAFSHLSTFSLLIHTSLIHTSRIFTPKGCGVARKDECASLRSCPSLLSLRTTSLKWRQGRVPCMRRDFPVGRFMWICTPEEKQEAMFGHSKMRKNCTRVVQLMICIHGTLSTPCRLFFPLRASSHGCFAAHTCVQRRPLT